MHAKPDLRAEFVHSDHFFRLGDLGRYPASAKPRRMENPYSAPTKISDQPKKLVPRSTANKILAVLTYTVLGVLSIGFATAACYLIWQSNNLQQQDQVRWSRILGIMSVLFSITMIAGILFAIRNRILAAWSTVLFCIVIYIFVVVLFGPS